MERSPLVHRKLPGSVRGSGLTCAVVGPSDIWATGTNRSTGTPVIERWNGRSWRPVGSITSVLPKLTKTTLAGLQAVNALSGRNVWVLADVGGWWSFNYVGTTPDRYVLHRVHGRWVKVLLPAGLDLSIGAFAHVPHTSAMLAVGDQFTAGHFEGVVLAFGRL